MNAGINFLENGGLLVAAFSGVAVLTGAWVGLVGVGAGMAARSAAKKSMGAAGPGSMGPEGMG